MKKETPHSLKCRAGLANGLKDDGARRRKLTMGRDQTAKRSPKERSAVPGTSDFGVESSSQPSGVVTPPDGPKRRLGSGWQDRGGVGTARPFLAGAVRPCLQLRLSPTGNTYLNIYVPCF